MGLTKQNDSQAKSSLYNLNLKQIKPGEQRRIMRKVKKKKNNNKGQKGQPLRREV